MKEDEERRQVERISRDYKGVFVHGILDKHVPGSNSLLQTGTSFETKLKLAIGLEPTISTSVIQRGDGPGSMWAQMGVVVSEGRVEGAHSSDSATVAESLTKRTVGFGRDSIEKIEASVPGYSPDKYNEFVVSGPQVAGMYYSPEHQLSKFGIPEKDFFQLSEELGLPPFVVQNGELYEVEWDDDTSEMKIGDKVDPAKLAERTKQFSQEEREQILMDALEQDMPFEIERILPEARAVASRSNGAELYMNLEGRKLEARETGEEVLATELGLDPEYTDYDKKRMLDGDTVEIIREIRYPEGKTVRLFENNGIVYEQDWSYEEKTFGKSFKKVKGPGKNASRYIEISFNTWELDSPVRDAKGYLYGMDRSVRHELEDFSKLDPEDTRGHEYFRGMFDRLSFHLHGFAEEAERCGDVDSSQRALEIAQLIKSDEEYQQVIDRRLDDKGRFKITKEDLE